MKGKWFKLMLRCTIASLKQSMMTSFWKLTQHIGSFEPVANGLPDNYRIGDIEDANVLIQNSLWLSVPIGQLGDQQSSSKLARSHSMGAQSKGAN